MTYLFSYDNPSVELSQDDSVEVALDESQLDSNLKSENQVSQEIDEQDSTINDSNNQLVNTGSANSYVLRASLNTYSAVDQDDALLTSSDVESFDVLSAEEGADDALTAEDDKKSTIIIADDVVGTPAEIVNVYAIVMDEDGNAVDSGTAVFTTNGQTYYSKVRNGLAIFYDVELPMGDSVDEIDFLEDDNYKASSTMINIIVEIDPDEGNPEDIPEDIIQNDSSTNQSNYSAGLTKEPISNLGKYPTANPIMAFLLALIAVVGSGVRIRK